MIIKNSEKLKVIAIVPARKNSKGILNKNIADLNGKPLICYTLHEAIKSKYIDSVIVSTDGDDIARISVSIPGIIIHKRPEELAQDQTPTLPVLKNVLDHFNYVPDIVVTLQPTSPLRNVQQIDEAIELLTLDFDSCISVCETEHTPYKMFKIENEQLKDLFSEISKGLPRQLLPKTYRENGAIYVTWTNCILEKRSIWGEKTKAYLMDSESSIDIDYHNDLIYAEFLLKLKEGKK
ncbi:MAG: acylneuraminate cytidylyltransferase [Chloroflexi bacterium HGW-Chloroflexi-3]|nr:MAG: acylneuraminate cytidylyltransferase [Chloroflexi bacterium HGW-Chloroflexi-3]